MEELADELGELDGASDGFTIDADYVAQAHVKIADADDAFEALDAYLAVAAARLGYQHGAASAAWLCCCKWYLLAPTA